MKTLNSLILGAAALTLGTTSASAFVTIFGTTSVSLDFETLASAASLELASANPTATPATGFDVGFQILGPAAFFGPVDSDPFMFDLDGGLVPTGGDIDHTGSVTFDTPIGLVEVGNFTIGFDPVRVSEMTSGFFVEDTISGLGILFDVGIPSALSASSPVGGLDASIGPADLLVSPEFGGFLLTNSFSSIDLSGEVVGSARIDLLAIPEPSALSLFAFAGVAGLLALRRRV